MPRTRVTVLSGFLGSGKTTLLNGLLRDAPEPLGVIVNDFGAVNVDAALVSGQTSVEGEVALQNGCICCTIRGDLLAALLSLQRRSAPPRHVVIEASGVSDPGAVARTIIDPRVQEHLELAAVVGCVDPVTFPTLVGEDWSLATDQIRACDFVVLTKEDATTADQRNVARELVRTLAPRARLLKASLDSAPTALLLGSKTLWSGARTAASSPVLDPPHVHEVGAAHGHHHRGGHAFETWTYRSEATLSTYALRRALIRLPGAVLRAKGFVRVAEDPDTRLLVQVVGGRAELRAEGPWGASPPRTELVFLGREGTLPVEALGGLFDGCRHDGRPAGEGFMDEMLGYFNRLLSGVPGHLE